MVKSFYDELRKIFSTEKKDKNYAAMQKRIIAWLDHSEMRMLEAVKKQLKTDIATKQEVTKIFSNMSELLEKETARLNKYLAEENRQYAKSVIVSNCIKKGYQTYQFVAEGENCEDCNSLSGKTFPLAGNTVRNEEDKRQGAGRKVQGMGICGQGRDSIC